VPEDVPCPKKGPPPPYMSLVQLSTPALAASSATAFRRLHMATPQGSSRDGRQQSVIQGNSQREYQPPAASNGTRLSVSRPSFGALAAWALAVLRPVAGCTRVMCPSVRRWWWLPHASAGSKQQQMEDPSLSEDAVPEQSPCGGQPVEAAPGLSRDAIEGSTPELLERDVANSPAVTNQRRREGSHKGFNELLAANESTSAMTKQRQSRDFHKAPRKLLEANETASAATEHIQGLIKPPSEPPEAKSSFLDEEGADFHAKTTRKLSQAEDPDVRRRGTPPPPSRVCDYGDPFAKPGQGGCCEACKRAAKKYTHFKDSDLDPGWFLAPLLLLPHVAASRR
jgi:hypothetical protein